ncbi:MAG: penicillin-binding transpeptidase domain-containing protein [Magnetospirillum sp.]|nr:penicillin-binding transpeptidase domain-containing protein [Magnetospirillum sp.]
MTKAVLAVCLFLLAGVAPAFAQAGRVVERPDLEHFFAEAGTQGTMVVHDHAKDVWFVVGARRAEAGTLPASTFKIFNALAALSLGVVKDVDSERFASHTVPINGVPSLPAECDGLVTLRVAFRYSCVPAYQEVARRVGVAAFQRLVDQTGYGNGEVASVPVDRFWLEGAFRISALGQVRFLDRLYAGDLPFTPAAMAGVRDIMRLESVEDAVIRAKTGYATASRPAVGWWVGWVERGGQTSVFALNLDVTDPAHLKARQSIAKAILGQLGLLP